jgi:hypothetical protein
MKHKMGQAIGRLVTAISRIFRAGGRAVRYMKIKPPPKNALTGSGKARYTLKQLKKRSDAGILSDTDRMDMLYKKPK